MAPQVRLLHSDWMLSLEKLEYCGSTIKLFKCAVAQTFKILFNVKLGDFLSMKKFVRSISMKDPVEAKYEETFDIKILIQWIKNNLAGNDVLDEKQLRLKVILLVRIFSLKRCLDLVCITMEHLVLEVEEPHFCMVGSKGLENGHVSRPFRLFPIRILIWTRCWL